MTAEDLKVTGKRNVLVGIKFDGHARELLDWAVVKVAEPGDCVIGLHICRNSDSPSKAQTLLDGYLDDYGGLCNQKQVGISVEVVQGSSFRKLLVKIAKNRAAVAVLVGINKGSPLGGRYSIAKYCAKRLPLNIEVLAIHNGKIVYRRSCNAQQLGNPKPSLYPTGNSKLSEHQPEFGDSEISYMGRLSHEVPRNCDYGCMERNRNSKDEVFSVIERRTRSSLSSLSLPVEDFTQQKPGWPLLQTASAVSLEARKMSVVQWVMTLPSRTQMEFPQFKSSLDPTENASGGLTNCFSVKNGTTHDISISVELPKDLRLLFKTKSPGCKLFDYHILKSSTSQFSSENLIGKGGSNCVYKGILPDGKPVAVKILKSSKEAWNQFCLEVEFMTRLKHRSIASLLGICVADKDLISVYEYHSKGNLADNINRIEKGKSVLPWEVRYNIAIQIASALNSLHNECPRPVIHRDVKSSNILLTDKFEAQLSDFGLAIWGPTKASFLVDTDIVGTFGYLAPEYFRYGRVSDKVDVYSFGVVLLELLSGREPIGIETSKGQESLVLWAKAKLENGDLKGILDQNLDVNINEAQMQRMTSAAKLCLSQSARLRPNMSQILKLLTGKKDLKDLFMKSEQQEDNDDEVYPDSNAVSHLGLALLGVNDNSTSFGSPDQSSPLSVEGYLKTR